MPNLAKSNEIIRLTINQTFEHSGWTSFYVYALCVNLSNVIFYVQSILQFLCYVQCNYYECNFGLTEKAWNAFLIQTCIFIFIEKAKETIAFLIVDFYMLFLDKFKPLVK